MKIMSVFVISRARFELMILIREKERKSDRVNEEATERERERERFDF
jgi:hypothetical protein